MQIINLHDCTKQANHPLNFESMMKQLRTVFSQVFSQHYAQIITNALQASDNDKSAKTLAGFADLEKKYFGGNFNKYSNAQIQQKLAALYYDAGFADEVAFLRACQSGIYDPSLLNADDSQEMQTYLADLHAEQRQLLEVNVAIIVDEKQRCKGFAIYHLMQQNNEVILHIRQAAISLQNRGLAMQLGRYLADKYPQALYEANQRRGNTVHMKNRLLAQQILYKSPAVLGYNDEFYFGLQSFYKASDAITKHDHHKPHQQRYSGNYREAEDAKPYFSAVSFFKQYNQDDMFVNKNAKKVVALM